MQKILSRVIFIGFSIQIVLGILWMCNAFAGFTQPVEGIVCVGSMILVGVGTLFLKRSMLDKGKPWAEGFVLLCVLTFPFVMQCLINPDYRIWITVILMFGTGCILRVIRKKKGMKSFLWVLCFWVSAGGVVVGLESVQHGWIPVSTWLTERIVWTSLSDSYAKLSELGDNPINYSKMIDSTYEVAGIRTVLVPYLEETLGEQETARVLGELRAVAWEYGKKQIIKEIIWDVAGYTVSPVILPLQLSGRAYESYSGINYRELLQPAPQIGSFYVTYSCWWFAVALVLGVLLTTMYCLKNSKCISVYELLVLGFTQLGMVVGYAMNGAGRMDYKNTLFVLSIWLIWMAAVAMRVLEAERVSKQLGGNQDEKE